MIRLAVIIPDRGDRPEFMQNCKRMLASQTLQPDHIEIVDFPAVSDAVDITPRYRTGYDNLRNKGFDLIALMENDDWYSPEYLENMVNEWKKAGKPKIFGTNQTIYYQIQHKCWCRLEHMDRASAMNTFIVPDLDFEWCVDNEPYTDIHLWKVIEYKDRGLFRPEKHISLGIKHGIGKCGGGFHTTLLARYINPDPNMDFIRDIMDLESFEFYSNYFNK